MTRPRQARLCNDSLGFRRTLCLKQRYRAAGGGDDYRKNIITFSHKLVWLGRSEAIRPARGSSFGAEGLRVTDILFCIRFRIVVAKRSCLFFMNFFLAIIASPPEMPLGPWNRKKPRLEEATINAQFSLCCCTSKCRMATSRPAFLFGSHSPRMTRDSGWEKRRSGQSTPPAAKPFRVGWASRPPVLASCQNNL